MSEHVRMPAERASVTRKIKIADLEGYVVVGLREDGSPGEIFLTFQQMGSTERGLCHALAMISSVALQHGVPLEKICDKLTDLKFEPAGFTGDKDIPSAHSVADYIGRWLAMRFLRKEEQR